MTATITPATTFRCKRGHLLTDENVYWVRGTHGQTRRCRTCRRLANKRYAARRDAQPGVTTMPDRPTATSIGDISWHADAACSGANLALFFPNDGETGIPDRARNAAETHCANCPVRDRCDTDATALREYGLWGGKWRARDSRTRQYRITDLVNGEPSDEWVDDVTVERAVNGHAVGRKLTAAERAAVARELADRGYGSTHIADALGVSGTTATRLLKDTTT
ncbi:WhiB family transcriptional regulator [Saccharopolyspora sp. NPDC000359]|uniref:WhiB family transcriptional regulator n=1 Tax=Saccharopolyspora sp. NPDC000359 TaxID=3154251 RepID=UPI003319B485